MTADDSPVVYVISCAAPPLLRLTELLDLLGVRGWDPCVILTPTAATWVSPDVLGGHTRHPVRVHPRPPHEPDPLPPASAVLAAPLTFNTLNKWAAGVSDTLALGLLNEALGCDVPVIAAPVIKAALRQHPVYPASVQALRSADVEWLDPDAITTRQQDGTVGLAWDLLAARLDAARPKSGQPPSPPVSGSRLWPPRS